MIGSRFVLIATIVALSAGSISCNVGEHEHHGASGEHQNVLSAGLASLGGGLGGVLGGIKKVGGVEDSLVVPTKSQEKTEIKVPLVGGAVEKKEEGFLGAKSSGELLKLMLNPIEFCAKVAKFFKLKFEKFFPLVTKGLNFGLELAVQPFLITLKIIEKIFVPDVCKLRFVCKLSHPLSFAKSFVPKMSDKILNESKMFRAMSDGLHGADCEAVYHCNGSLKLKDEYKGDNHHQPHHHNQQHQNHENHQGGELHHGGGDLHQHHEGEHHGESHHHQHEILGEQHNEPIYAASNLLKSLKSLKSLKKSN